MFIDLCNFITIPPSWVSNHCMFVSFYVIVCRSEVDHFLFKFIDIQTYLDEQKKKEI